MHLAADRGAAPLLPRRHGANEKRHGGFSSDADEKSQGGLSSDTDGKNLGGLSSDTDTKNHAGLSNDTIFNDTEKKSRPHGIQQGFPRTLWSGFQHCCIGRAFSVGFCVRKVMPVVNTYPESSQLL